MSIWAIKDKDDYMRFSNIAEIQVVSGTKRKELIYSNVSNVVFYPSMKMLEFVDCNTEKRIFIQGSFILKEK